MPRKSIRNRQLSKQENGLNGLYSSFVLPLKGEKEDE